MQQSSEQFELMKRGESYHFDEFLFGKQKKCERKLKKINSLPFDSSRRNKMLGNLFAGFGENNVIKSGFNCNFGFNITIGSGCYINYGVTILDSFEVVIGNNVFIAPNVIISPVTHPLEWQKRRDLIGGKIVIEDNAWIGGGAIILPGVTIGAGAVVGAGSVVKENVKPNSVVAGAPARFIKEIKQ